MYCSTNFKTKKQLKEAVARYNEGISKSPITLYAPGLGKPATNGHDFVEGPWYPEPHRWYAKVAVKDGIVTKVS